MSDNSAIEWCDATWGPTLGCTKVSAGCEQCYAIRGAHIRQSNPNPKVAKAFEGLTRKFPDGSVNWTGRVNLLEDRLSIPLRWKKPRRIFVDSQSDLFHEAVPVDFITSVFAIMETARQHTFQLLTKRPERMKHILSSEMFWGHVRKRGIDMLGSRYGGSNATRFRLPNVWLGVSTEDQAAADERIPLLLQTPAAVRFLSCEPLLGPINLNCLKYMTGSYGWLSAFNTTAWPELGRVDWVIVGGESGPNYRPFDLDWARQIRDQTRFAGAAFFFKQVGGRTSHAGGRLLDGVEHNDMPRVAVPV